MKKIKKIAAIMDFASQSARDFATGLFAHMRTHGAWRLMTLPSSRGISKAAFSRMAKNGVVGVVLLRDIPPECEKIVAESPMKVVSATLGKASLVRRKTDITYTLVDNEGMGVYAANRLMALGKFKTYAFLSPSRVSWALLREKGFRSALRAKHLKASALRSTEDIEVEQTRNLVRKWLLSLERPAALFAATDCYARLAADICTECGMSVPTDVSILGVDNDEFFCLSNSPRLSSICPDHIGLGEAAGREMDRLLSAKAPLPSRRVIIRGHSFFERESTRAKTTGYNIAMDAANYIRNHSHLGIRPETVARRLGVSRRLLDLRFRQIDGRSLNEAILQARLERARQMLSETDAPIAEIADSCAFRHVSYLTRLFKKTYGMPPAAWRDINASSPATSPQARRNAASRTRQAAR